jgi:hypothetical protein
MNKWMTMETTMALITLQQVASKLGGAEGSKKGGNLNFNVKIS